MRTRLTALALAAALTLAAAPPATAQSNAQVGLDVSLSALGSLSYRGRTGTWPSGENAVSMSTTSCNVGVVDVPWLAAMNERHPMIAFVIVAERNGRLVQISDRSYVKHGFNSTNSQGCGSCPGGAGTSLVVGCSDTYGVGTNANNFHLGPPEEIDPWLGTWTAACSHFDRGEPAVAAPLDCDGVRSLSNAQATALGPVGHRVRVLDAEFENPDNTKLAHQAYYVIRAEFENARANNIGWRTFNASWNGTGNSYILNTTTNLTMGSVLNAWTGATVSSGSDGGFNGRIYVAGKASQPGSLWHYEYAIQNRDNVGGVDELRIPLTPGATISNAGMRDLDGNALNDWTSAVVGNELVFTGTSNPLEWNSIYNVWFDSNAAPATGDVELEQVLMPDDIAVTGLPTPSGALPAPGVSYCTAGTSSLGCTALISGTGAPSASAPTGFVLTGTAVEGAINGQFFFAANGRQANPWGTSSSFQCVAPPVMRGGILVASGTSGACNGDFNQDLNARWTAKPNQNPGSGAVVQAQLWYRDPFNTSNQTTSLSDAYEFTVLP